MAPNTQRTTAEAEGEQLPQAAASDPAITLVSSKDQFVARFPAQREPAGRLWRVLSHRPAVAIVASEWLIEREFGPSEQTVLGHLGGRTDGAIQLSVGAPARYVAREVQRWQDIEGRYASAVWDPDCNAADLERALSVARRRALDLTATRHRAEDVQLPRSEIGAIYASAPGDTAEATDATQQSLPGV